MTAPRQADEHLRGRSEHLAEAWDDAPYPVLIADFSGEVRAVNRAASVLLPDADSGRSLGDVAPAWLAHAHAELARGGPRRHTIEHDARAGGRGHGGQVPPQGTPGGPGDRTPSPARGDIGGRSFAAHPKPLDEGGVVWWLTEDTLLRRLEGELRQERERTEFLASASQELLASLNAGRCMEVTASLAARHLGDAAVVIAPGRGQRYPVTSCGPNGEVSRTTVVADLADVPGLMEAMQGFPPVPSRWIDPAALPEWVLPEPLAGAVSSVVVTPLPGHGVPAGALILLRTAGHEAFTEAEEVFARIFAARAGSALSAARLYAEQTSISDTLMRELLPPTLRSVHGVEFAGGYRSSGESERVGGDFYDVHPGRDEQAETLVVLGDVCGKGLDAAVLTGKIRNTLQALLSMQGDHLQMLRLLNGALVNSHHTRYATLALVSVARRKARVDLRITSAGHPPPLLVRAGGTVEEARTRGTLVGALPHITATSALTRLEPGEVCLMYTDGITEAVGGPLGDEMFGEERLKDALSECYGLPAEAVVERIQMLASEWVGSGPHDDIAVVAIAVPRHNHLSAVDGHTRGRYTA
ncbi:GAF domain-containing SpoIIE family protein phosphatase [Streptomyces sp. NPDC001941]|uniref:PP2C family protein-serine/threonine phosphatase n=1 Tax=Streptomyces sp. NPDC001941 TaxID=3154659 RepID=UPI003323C290